MPRLPKSRPCAWIPCCETVSPPRLYCAEHKAIRVKILSARLGDARAEKGECIRGCGRPAHNGTSLCRPCKTKQAQCHNAKRRREFPNSKLKTCGECGEKGHNIRTCPKNPDNAVT